MAVLEGLPTAHYDPELKAAAVERAAVLIEGVKLAALTGIGVMSEPDVSPSFTVNADSPNMQNPRIQYVLFPNTPIQKIEITKIPPFTTRKEHVNADPMELSFLALAGVKAGAIYFGGRTPQYAGPTRRKECERISFEVVLFNPEEHELALYRDSAR